MWILTTRNRPEMCRRFLEACVETEVSTPGLVWMDGCDYGDLPLPRGWQAWPRNRHLNIGAILHGIFERNQDWPWYGWIADDCVPKTKGWDRALVEAAGTHCVAYPNDEWQQGVKERYGTPHVTSAVVMGGDLVRAMGLWTLPGQIQMYIDDVWESVAVPCGLMRYLPEVVVEHQHFANGKRQRDETDARTFNGIFFPAHDAAIYRGWLASESYRDTLSRVANLR